MHARGHLGKGNHWNRQGMWGRDKEIQEPSLVTRGTTKMHLWESLSENGYEDILILEMYKKNSPEGPIKEPFIWTKAQHYLYTPM